MANGKHSHPGESAAAPRANLRKDKDYETLAMLWSAGVGHYHSLFYSYLTAHAFFVAAATVTLAVLAQQHEILLLIVLTLVCLLGVFIGFQMAVALGRFSAENVMFEYRLRGLEHQEGFDRARIFTDLWNFRENVMPVNIPGLETQFKPKWPIRVHRRWFGYRSRTLPWVLIIFYVSAFLCGTFACL